MEVFFLNGIVKRKGKYLKATYVTLRAKKRETRLTYNCAHLRLTKESLTVEFANKNV